MANTYNFVKFLRGSQEAYDRLAVKDINTLYFIYDANAQDDDTPNGKLYLGQYLITDTDASSIALSDLTDTDIGELTGTEILRYNKNLDKWQPVLVSDLLEEIDFNAGVIVNSGITKISGQTDIEAIDAAVSEKKEGDLAIVDNAVYVYDGEQWVRLIDSSVADVGALADRVNDLETAMDNVYTKAETDSAINQAISLANHLTYTTVASLENLDPAAATSQNKVYLVQKPVGELNDGYDEFLAVNGAWERIGTFGTDLSGYVQTDDPRLLTVEQVGQLNNLLDENGFISVSSIKDFNDNILIKSVEPATFNVTSSGQLQLISIPQSVLDTDNFALKSTVGDLADLYERSDRGSTTNLVEEINVLADHLTWKPIEE